MIRLLLLLMLSGIVGCTASARQPDETIEVVVKDDPSASTTRHVVTIDGNRVAYEATAGYMKLPDYVGETIANVFYVSYVKEGVEDKDSRPVLFSFNGGPGSSSVWLHLGTIGPRRVVMTEEGWMPPPPARLEDNAWSWLDLADLVFIDPVSTGYSRPVEGESKSQFHGLHEDIRSVGEFIRLWTTRNERWASPKFLCGESYGTTRAAGLAGHLQDQFGMYLTGIILVSPVLNFQTLRFSDGNDLPYWLFLPTYTATAWFHGRLPADLQGAGLAAALRESERFARTEYLPALALGSDLAASERDRVAGGLARLTGLSKEWVLRADLRIQIFAFTKELLRDQGRTVGRLDSRFKGIDGSLVSDSMEHDPSMTAIRGPYSAALNHYVRTELEYENDLVYEILTGRVHPWSYASSQNRYVNVAETLREAMSKNPYLQVLSCCGYYDLATPYYAMDYTLAHLGLDASLRDNITKTYYESGHMMYIRHFDLVKLKEDVRAFVERALQQR